jgi:hypothetical protein
MVSLKMPPRCQQKAYSTLNRCKLLDDTIALYIDWNSTLQSSGKFPYLEEVGSWELGMKLAALT